MFLLAPFAFMQRTSADPSPASTFLVSPPIEALNVNDSFTITVNLTNAQHLFAWEVDIKFNGTGLRLSDLSIPDDNVFAGYACFPTPVVVTPASDLVDGFTVVSVAETLLGEFDVANVDSGVLCRVNFTVIGSGPALIVVTDKSNPCQYVPFENVWYSHWLNPTDVSSNQTGEEDALGSNCTVFTVSPLVGDVNGDYKVNIEDVSIVAAAFGSNSTNPRWNSNADINNDGHITIEDVALITKRFGRHFP